MRWPAVLALSLALNLVGWSLFGLWLGSSSLRAHKPDMELSVVHVTPKPTPQPPQAPEIKPPLKEASTPAPRPRPKPQLRRVRPRPRPQPKAKAQPPRKIAAVKAPTTPQVDLTPTGTVPATPKVQTPTVVLRRAVVRTPVRRVAPAPRPTRKGPNLAVLRARIRHAVNRHRHYPRQARRRGIEGRVVLAFRLSPAGSIKTLKVVRSAGRLLDKAAVAALRRAAPLPYYPDVVRLPVVFQLED